MEELDSADLQRYTFYKVWACSAAGSAPHSHCGGREFESPQVHQIKAARQGGFFLQIGCSEVIIQLDDRLHNYIMRDNVCTVDTII